MSRYATASAFEEQRFVDVGDARVCHRKAGEGPALVLLHGFPLSGMTWRRAVPELSKHFTCHAVDLLGLGNSTARGEGDFSSQGQAELIRKTMDALGVLSYALVGHDTGGWIARELALLDGARVTHLALINTEIPGHRPPWIPLYQRLARLPGSVEIFRRLLGSRYFRRSAMGFGGCFVDLDLIEGDFAELFLAPLAASREKLRNAFRFLVGMKFDRLDRFAELHGKLLMPVTFLWGADDPTFPEARARAMASQFPNVSGFHSIPKGKLLVHEERPTEIARATMEFVERLRG